MLEEQERITSKVREILKSKGVENEVLVYHLLAFILAEISAARLSELQATLAREHGSI